MTGRLEQAIQRARELPESQQDAIAALILEEISDEARWDSAFGRSQEALARLAQEARDELDAGVTEELESDRL